MEGTEVENVNKKINWQYAMMASAFLILALVPLFMSNNYYITILNQMVINMIVVLGLNFITGLAGQMNLGTAGIYALGAYTSALLSRNFGLSPWLTMVAAVVVGFLIGRGLGYPSLKMKGVYLSLTTLAFSEIIRILATNLMDITGGTQGIKNIPRFCVLFWNLDTNVKYFYFVWTVAVLLCLLSMRIAHSKWGREFKAVKDNAEAIESLGLDIKKIKIRAFTLAAVYGALGGALYAHFNQFVTSLSFTTDLSISYVIMLMIGGIGNILGNMIGAIVITILPEMLRFLGEYYQITFCTMVLLLSLIHIFGARTDGHVSVITMGPDQAREVLLEAVCMGAERGYLISDRCFAGADVCATSHTLSQGIRQSGTYDLILCGKQTTDGDTAQVGAETAEFLGIAHGANILEVLETGDTFVTVRMNLENKIQTQKMELPCLLTVDKDVNTPRLPSYKRRIGMDPGCIKAVSYTHLDVYKRQAQ